MYARAIEPVAPDLLARRLARREGFVWLDGDGSPQGRHSYLAIEPSEILQADTHDPDPLAKLAALPRTPGMHAPRYIGFIAYDGREPLPRLCFGRYDAVIEIDHTQGTMHLLGERDACARLERALQAPATEPLARAGDVRAETREVHAHAIREALAAIGRGDVYEVNLARRFDAPFEGDPLALFLAMREASPVPFGAFLTGPGYAIASRSMERFLEWSPEGRLVTRPIKGTIAHTPGSAALARDAALRADEKERAEHVMIVDLMRNDLGRVAEVGSVRVESLFDVEPYAGLSHLVSTVACRTRPGTSLGDVLSATFPPGSITGAPKRAAVQTIASLERHARGPYTGAIGFVTGEGALSFSVAIRTAVIEGGRATYFAGGGIVEASDPDREVAETELKAKVFMDAIARLPRT